MGLTDNTCCSQLLKDIFLLMLANKKQEIVEQKWHKCGVFEIIKKKYPHYRVCQPRKVVIVIF